MLMDQMVERQSKILEAKNTEMAELQRMVAALDKSIGNKLEEIDRLKSIRVETESQIKQLTLDNEIKDRNIEHLTLIIARDRERVSAELAQYAAAASGVPVKSVTTNVLSSVTPQ
jgi:septal ring factor EnvC (AmiA/AmiB activator)